MKLAPDRVQGRALLLAVLKLSILPPGLFHALRYSSNTIQLCLHQTPGRVCTVSTSQPVLVTL